ncbi:HWE histidine kinase domain-containing protein [Tropicimonas sediminicola]|uniref:histidine kinase n=1 Tax=Tropicimonas sediminicola TaxID=1031541 RepID=A0A239JAA7_9RHOB|nr:HWE histidine kinase domain-containing protein [Tropicimonas sediminicola]SNT02831.1 Bacteriophytochrome (light-regulated signal transduction histidine kinase) [Tropicimonas sediminicola]
MSDPDFPGRSADVDLTNCDREPIHRLGRVQDFGCLIGVSSDWMITHASENCGELLGLPSETLIGTRLMEVFSEPTVHDLRTRMQVLGSQDGHARVFGYAVFGDARLFDISIHRSGRQILFEFEPRRAVKGSPQDDGTVQALIARVQRHDTVEHMAAEAARGLKALSGFGRVMVYRFEDDDSGTVIAEVKEPGQAPFLGLRYPASDIPKQARALYTRSLLRLIADVDGPTHAIHPEFDPSGEPLDLSLSVTRAVSPIHLEYLRNMGVAASMSVSILRKGKLWGLFACHHDAPRAINYETRTSIELFAQLFNYELAQLEMNSELADVDRARGLHDRLMSQLSSGGSLFGTFESFVEEIREVIEFDGAVIFSEGRHKAVGPAPTEDELAGLARFLNTTPPAQVYATENLGARYSKAEAFADRAAGLLALPISRTPRDYLVLFRREIAQSVTWAGNPEKPVETGPNGIRLTPRKSFEAWQEVVHGRSAAWKDSERRAADALRVTLLEVVLKLADESNAARKRAQDQQELLIAELNHRVRNILNLIRGLVSQGQGDSTSVEAFQSVLDARIHALARAHDQLTLTEWSWTSFRALVETEVTAFLADGSPRVHITGAEIELSPEGFTTLALVVHELVTNSAKYGALSVPTGSVALDVALDADGTASLRWHERDGPAVKPPTRKGFGTTIIERSIPFELRGEANLRYRVTGVEAEFTLPARHVRASEGGDTPKVSQAPTANGAARISGNALVVEDNMIIALDAADMLSDLGAAAVQTAGSVVDAMKVLDEGGIAFVLADVNLGDEVSFPVVERCIAQGIGVILATGYGPSEDIAARFPNVQTLKKPYTIEHLRALLTAERR